MIAFILMFSSSVLEALIRNFLMNIIIFLYCIFFSSLTFAKEGNPICVDDVEGDFQKLNSKVETVHKYKPNKKFKLLDFKLALFNRLGINNHFQGIGHSGSALILSGANYKKRAAHLFVLKDGKVISKIRVGSGEHWHTGGIQTVGNIVAVSIEPYKSETETKSFIKFFDFSDLKNPKEITNIRLENHPGHTPSVALNRLKDGRYILVSHSNGRLSFYLTKTSNLYDGFQRNEFIKISREDVSHISEEGDIHFGGSSMALISQCDGEYFLIAFSNYNKSRLPIPFTKGEDYATLFKVGFLSGIEGQMNPDDSDKSFNYLNRKIFHCKRKCSFGAGGGIRITQDRRLHLLSTRFFREYFSGKIVISEFSP